MISLEWIIVPVILIAVIAQGMSMAYRKSFSPRARASAKAGSWSGLIIFVIFIVSQRSKDWVFSFMRPSYGFLAIPTAIGAIFGFILQSLIQRLRDNHIAVGGLALFQVAGGTIALFSYVFLVKLDNRGEIAFIALGIALGVLIYEMLFPSGIEKSIEVDS